MFKIILVVAAVDLKGTTVNLSSCGILIILGPGIPQGSCSISVFLENEAATAFATSNISCLQMPSKLYIPAQMNIRIKYPFFFSTLFGRVDKIHDFY